MRRSLLAAIILTGFSLSAIAQTKVEVASIVRAEESFNKLVERKGIKDGFLAVADPEGIVFKPNTVKITDFYSGIQNQPGKLSSQPKFARLSANGDLGFTAGPYVYQNGKTDDDKVYGDYVSIWRLDNADSKFKLLVNLGIQHPEPEQEVVTDFKEPDLTKQKAASKDPFAGKSVLTATDKTLNHSLELSAMAAYKEFLSPEARYYFPGFEPMTGSDKILKFIDNEGISISAETDNVGRSTSNDLAYTYGTARIRKGNIVNNYNYVRIWEIDANHRWNMLLEIFSTVEN
ncbi:nuclear transport factor 2 family protein [Mucilaginibacter sp. RB4R14]|uniref:nuclear transport factor 2 family protein n=1 Tax=Mucilaginibacter aurantiaciroseus TaxID=2949308 RepID=UPI002091C965|nr:nuclear transport factor 2 family protein [Mucilaginibacter aurantiaciroseus]MCO5937293.1 nuclear transport factor 2 family protein [Mucilaginibacter aurantiaciroseus]